MNRGQFPKLELGPELLKIQQEEKRIKALMEKKEDEIRMMEWAKAIQVVAAEFGLTTQEVVNACKTTVKDNEWTDIYKKEQ